MTDLLQYAAPLRSTAQPSASPINVVLIDDNRLQREGLAALIHAQPGFCMLVASADVDEALEQVRDRQPDVVLLDLRIDDEDGLTLAATIRGELPEARVIVMGLSPSQRDVTAYVAAGVAGFIMKDASFDEYLTTVRSVAAGAHVLPEALTGTVFGALAARPERTTPNTAVEASRKAVRLTNRERDVIDLLSEGLSNRDIAERLGIAVHTVKSHVHSVLEKLSLNSRLQVAAFTHALGGSKSIGL
jgi:DNA-binding NarL/FixJ family response regulator